MSHILHLGHQPLDLSGAANRLSTSSAGFEATLDVNCLAFSGTNSASLPFSLAIAEPAGEIWLGVRYRTPSADAHNITSLAAHFLEFLDAENRVLAQVRPRSDTNRYHAIAHGSSVVEGTSSFTAPSGTAIWIDLRLAVGDDITVEFYVDGVLHSSASAPNTGKGKPRKIIFTNTGLHSNSISSRSWFYAHIAVLDGVSTIGRRFIRRSPGAVASFNEMSGSIDALSDGDIATRITSAAPGQRLSFTLSGPTGPAAVSGIAGVHLKQIAQAGSDGPQAIAGFLRMGGVNHDAAPVTVSPLAPGPVYASWALNPVDASPWSSATLPTEVGILSA